MPRPLEARVRLGTVGVELRCSRCREWLRIDRFARRAAAGITGRQSHCRDCERGVQARRSAGR